MSLSGKQQNIPMSKYVSSTRYVNIASVQLRMLTLVVHRTNIFKTETKMRKFTLGPFISAVCGDVRCRKKCLDSGKARPALRPIQPIIQSVQVAISLVIKSPRNHADHSHLVSRLIMNWAIFGLLPHSFATYCLIKHWKYLTYCRQNTRTRYLKYQSA